MRQCAALGKTSHASIDHALAHRSGGAWACALVLKLRDTKTPATWASGSTLALDQLVEFFRRIDIAGGDGPHSELQLVTFVNSTARRR